MRRLARLYDVQTAYNDVMGHRRTASPESLFRVLQALGAPLAGFGDVGDAFRQREAALAAEVIAPVIILREGTAPRVTVRTARGRIRLELAREDGTTHRWTEPRSAPGGSRAVAIPDELPAGYHRLRILGDGVQAESTLIVAPSRTSGRGPAGKMWGVFLPLYALRTGADWGAGDFSGLGAMAAWVRTLGGAGVATLPLLPVFLDQPFDPSPYAPISRKFWNEFYVDVEAVPELRYAPAAQTLLSSREVQGTLSRQRRAPLVHYREQMQLKRRFLQLLSEAFFAHAPAARREAFARFVARHPAAEDYARFRAVTERQRRPWSQWPQRLRDGTVHRADFDDAARRYHLYAQWVAQEQFATVSGQVRAAGGIVYLDLPVCAHASGYDVWRERQAFVTGVSTGSPPDAFIAQGQDWGSPPLHPEGLRRQGYRYYIECVRHHLAHAALLRIDHVMGLHRCFWIPRGLRAADGVYVRYRAEEFYAILAIESVRHQATLVGENLGTVPAYVNAALRRYRVLQTYAVQYALTPGAAPLAPAPTDAVAGLNTHDLPPFAAFWSGRDLRDVRRLGQLSPARFDEERRRRRAVLRSLARFLRRGRAPRSRATPRNVVRELLAYLGRGPARVVLVNLEDLWLETRAQNVPGTSDEWPNWRRKTRYTLERFRRMRAVTGALRDLDRSRRVDA